MCFLNGMRVFLLFGMCALAFLRYVFVSDVKLEIFRLCIFHCIPYQFEGSERITIIITKAQPKQQSKKVTRKKIKLKCAERERQSTINIIIRKMLRYIRWNNENKPRSTEGTNAFQSSCKKPVIYVSRCLVFQINMFHCRYAATNTTTTPTTTIQSDEINKNIYIMKFMNAVICMKTTQITNFIAMLKKDNIKMTIYRKWKNIS